MWSHLPPAFELRIVRHHARATDRLPAVFGGCVLGSLQRRVPALAGATGADVPLRNASLHALALWLSAVTEALEVEAPASGRGPAERSACDPQRM